MRIAVGNDIVQLGRAAELIRQGNLGRILHPAEIQRSSTEHIAGLIALKEAAVKALGLTADDWLQIRIRREGSKPTLDLMEYPETIESLDCSISHDGDYAVATVVVLYRE
jgi:holo-[acyl-carrier-protein] synthase